MFVNTFTALLCNVLPRVKYRVALRSFFLHFAELFTLGSLNSSLLVLPVTACKLPAGNRRSLGCESPVDFGKRTVCRTPAALPGLCPSLACVAPSTNVPGPHRGFLFFSSSRLWRVENAVRFVWILVGGVLEVNPLFQSSPNNSTNTTLTYIWLLIS